MNKGKRVKSAIVLLFSSLFLMSCNFSQKETGTYNVNLKKLDVWPWSDTSTYDKSNCSFKVTEFGKGFSIPYEFNAKDYEYLEIKFSQIKGGGTLAVDYSDKSSNMIGFVEYKNTAYIPLDSEKKSKITSIGIQSYTKNTSFTIESIAFVQDKPEVSTIIDKKTGRFNASISSIDLAKKMKTGVNLINTLDAFPSWVENQTDCGLASEICWNGYEDLDEYFTTKDMINYHKEQGFNCIRITTTWYNHLIDDEYTIDPEWMERVKQVVDWAIEAGYYVILNEHHSVHDDMNKPLQYGDGYIVRNNPTDIAESKRFLKAVWTQITTAFNGSYDEHLIFETMNEPRNTDSSEEHRLYQDRAYTYCSECKADIEIVNELNQLCLDTIRASGGNNAKRFVMIPGIFTYTGAVLIDEFKLPEDSANDKLMVTVHDYEVKEKLNEKIYTGETGKDYLRKTYAALNEKFVKNNIPVVVGETSLDASSLSNQLEWIEFYSKLTSSYGMPLLY